MNPLALTLRLTVEKFIPPVSALHARILCALCALCGCSICTIERAAAEVRIWSFEATIVANGDPWFTAAGVRLGDTVRGTFSFDPSQQADPGGDADFASYSLPPAFQGIRLAVENPRTNMHLEYYPLIDNLSESWVERWNYDDADNNADDSNGLTLYQVPVTPDPKWFDFIYVGFERPGLASDLSLPDKFNLEDWPLAWIWLWADPAEVNGITAEIHTITPVKQGDFNFDGSVDAQDYSTWQISYGRSGYSDADGNRDGKVDTADYVLWRDNLGVVSRPNSAAAVPEPAAFVLFAGAAAGRFLRRQQRA